MGTLVTSASKTDTKPNMTVATVAAGSVVPVDGSFYVFIGSTATPQLVSHIGVADKCKDALREAGWPNPVTTEFSAAVFDTLTNSVTVTNGAAPTLLETDVAVIQGLDYNYAGSSNTGKTQRMVELYMEDVAKAA